MFLPFLHRTPGAPRLRPASAFTPPIATRPAPNAGATAPCADAGACSAPRWLLPCLLALAALSALWAGPAVAQTPAKAAPVALASASQPAPGTDAPLPSVDDLRRQLEAIPQKIKEDDDGRKLLTDVNAIGSAAELLAARRTEELADIDSRLAGLGPTPDKGAAPDAPDVAEQRASLAKQRAVVDGELKLARLISVDAEQRGTELIRQRREQFQAALTTRTDSPLGSTFWRALRNAAPGDMARLQSLGNAVRQAIDVAMLPAHRASFLLSLVGALLIAVAGTWVAERMLVRMAPARLPAGRLRRSLLAAASVLAYVVLIGMAVQLAWSGLTGDSKLQDGLKTLAQADDERSENRQSHGGLGQRLEAILQVAVHREARPSQLHGHA
ncbi:MAG: DUF3772 domain-containing protein, partial [Comamonadaceae bacterium]